jgi:hypothetical protein
MADQNTESPPAKKQSPWIAHVAAFRAEHPDISYKEALVQAKATYTSSNPNAKPRKPRTADSITKTKLRKLKAKVAALEASLVSAVAEVAVVEVAVTEVADA